MPRLSSPPTFTDVNSTVTERVCTDGTAGAVSPNVKRSDPSSHRQTSYYVNTVIRPEREPRDPQDVGGWVEGRNESIRRGQSMSRATGYPANIRRSDALGRVRQQKWASLLYDTPAAPASGALHPGRLRPGLRSTASLAACAATAELTACSGSACDAHNQTPPPADTPAITGAPTTHDGADRASFTEMITHHRQGLDLSALLPRRSSSTDVTAFAQTSANSMRADLGVMKAPLVQWTSNSDDTPSSEPSQTAVNGIADPATMERLAALSGNEFDTVWLQTALSFHAEALDMAHGESLIGKNVDAIVAQRMTQTEQTAIDQVDKLRNLSGNGQRTRGKRA